MIESSIITCDKFRVKYPEMPEGMKNDFQLIDLVLIKGRIVTDQLVRCRIHSADNINP